MDNQFKVLSVHSKEGLISDALMIEQERADKLNFLIKKEFKEAQGKLRETELISNISAYVQNKQELAFVSVMISKALIKLNGASDDGLAILADKLQDFYLSILAEQIIGIDNNSKPENIMEVFASVIQDVMDSIIESAGLEKRYESKPKGKEGKNYITYELDLKNKSWEETEKEIRKHFETGLQMSLEHAAKQFAEAPARPNL
jgi:hypothetical protein